MEEREEARRAEAEAAEAKAAQDREAHPLERPRETCGVHLLPVEVSHSVRAPLASG